MGATFFIIARNELMPSRFAGKPLPLLVTLPFTGLLKFAMSFTFCSSTATNGNLAHPLAVKPPKFIMREPDPGLTQSACPASAWPTNTFARVRCFSKGAAISGSAKSCPVGGNLRTTRRGRLERLMYSVRLPLVACPLEHRPLSEVFAP